jgi:hypothetical protein
MTDGRLRILAVCVSEYDDAAIGALRGPKTDAITIEWLFTSPDMGLYTPAQVEILKNPSSTEVRRWLLDYCSARSASGDVLVFYFSGHGAIIGAGEFAFCLKDARLQPNGEGVMPLSVLSFGDVVETLAAVNVNPVFIVDACYSGAAAADKVRPASEVMSLMHDDVHRKVGSSYAMLCACSDRETALDEIDGGIFTQTLADVLERGLPDQRRKATLQLHEVFPALRIACEQHHAGPASPRLYLGPGLPEFVLCKNAAHEELSYAFTGYLATLVRTLWNSGNPRSLMTAEIRQLSAGAYGNHRKLSFAPWDLVTDGSGPRERRLTDRGMMFAKGELKIPRAIRATSAETTNPLSWEAAPGTDDIGIADL